MNVSQPETYLGCAGNCQCCHACRNLDGLGEIILMKPEITFNSNRTYPNGRKAPDGIEIRFGTARPTLAIREMLKQHGFKFSEKQQMWYAWDNAKTRELVNYFNENEIEADNTQYEKLNFWARVRSLKEYAGLRDWTEFMIHGEPPQFYYNKFKLEKAGKVSALIAQGELSFKKYYNKEITTGSEPSKEKPEEEQPASAPKNKADHDLALKLRRLADGMQKEINNKLNPAISRQRATARRLRIASGMRREGLQLRETQDFLYALSAAHSAGAMVGFERLIQIKSKNEAELVLLYSRVRKEGWSEQAIQRHFDSRRAGLEKLNIKSVFDWSLASVQQEELIQRFSATAVREQRANENRINELLIEIAGSKIPGFFPTPKELVEQLISLAEIKHQDSILEPSAGKGDILDAITTYLNGDTSKLSACEVNYKLRELLELKGYKLVATDFLSLTSEKYDKIIMNPPFENGQDIDHVTHALSLLKPGGRLVAIMSEGVFFRQFKKDKAFQELLEEKNAFVSATIKDAFKGGFKSTGVAIRIVAINQNGRPIGPNEDRDEEPDTVRSETRNPVKQHRHQKQATKKIQHPGSEEEETEEETEGDEEQPEMKALQAEAELELQARAELELLRMRVEQSRLRKNKGLEGTGSIDPGKLRELRRKAWLIKDSRERLNYH